MSPSSLSFVLYPIAYGLWMGSDPALYRQLFDDPRYLTAVINTLLYVGIGVNVKMAVGLPAVRFLHAQGMVGQSGSGDLHPSLGDAGASCLYVDTLVPERTVGMLNNVLYLLFGIDGPVYLNSRWMGLAANIGAYIWKNLPFWTLILLSGRMAIPQELYEAASVDGANGLRRLTHVTLPLMANLYIVCVLLDTVFALGDFNATYFVSGGGPAMSTEVLATLGIRYAYTVSLPVSGWRR